MLSIAVLVLATAIAYQLFGEAAVYYEMNTTGATSRAELANDFGLGFLGLFFVVTDSVLVGIASSWITWRSLKTTKGTEGENT